MTDVTKLSDEELLGALQGPSAQPDAKSMSDEELLSALHGSIPDITDPNSPDYSRRHGGSVVTAIFDGIKSAVTLPRDVYEGKVDPLSDEGIGRTLDMAAIANPAAPAGLIPTARMAPKVVAAAKPTGEVAEAASRLSAEGAPVNVPKGVASDSPAVQAVFQRGQQAPGATGVVTKAVDDFYKGVESKVGEVAAKAGGGQVKDPATLGASVRGSLEGAVKRAEEQADNAFAVMRRAIDPEKRVDVLDGSVAKTLNGVMSNRAAAGEGAIAERLTPAFNILTDPKGVSFNGLQRARSQVGRAIQWDEANGGFLAADLKQTYGALTNAMESAARQSAKSNPNAASQLLKAADARFAKMMEDNKVLGSVLRKDADEGLVTSLISMASNKSGNLRKLGQVIREIGPEANNDLAGFVIGGLGRNRAGEFSPQIFENNWTALSPAGKALLFRESAVRKALDDLSIVTKRMAETQRKFANSSKTGGAVGQMAATAGLVTSPVTTIASIVGVNAVARVLARPAVARSAAQYAKAAEIAAKTRSPAAQAQLQRAHANLATAIERATPLAVNDNSVRQAVSAQ